MIMTPEDILNSEFPERALEDLHGAIDGLPHATHALWGLSYWLKDHGDLTGSMMVQEWATEFAEHEARRQSKRAQHARAEPRHVATTPPRRQALDLNNCPLDQFANAALVAARSVTNGRWHRAVFISAAWEQLQAGGADISLDRFKHRLFEAYQADLIDLSRADLVEAMPAGLVRDSEITRHGARFHFVRID